MLPLCADQGVGVIPWSPLGRGRLTRDWEQSSARQETDPRSVSLYRDSDPAIVETVARIAAERGVSRAQVALAWVMANPVVTAPIVGVTKPAHLEDAIAAVDLELTSEEYDDLSAGYQTRPVAF